MSWPSLPITAGATPPKEDTSFRNQMAIVFKGNQALIPSGKTDVISSFLLSYER